MPEIDHAEVDYNVVQNNGPGAAQVVPHTHFHIVPRYPFNSKYTPFGSPAAQHQLFTDSSSSSTTQKRTPIPQGIKATAILFGRGQRHYRDDDDALGLVELMRCEVAEEWRRTFGGGGGGATGRGDDTAAAAVEATLGEDVLRGSEGDGRHGDGGRRRVEVGTARENDLPVLESRNGSGGAGGRAKGGRL